MLEDYRQEEIKSEIIETQYLKQKFAVAEGLGAKLAYDVPSRKWIYSNGCISGVGDSPEEALSDLWKNFHSEDYKKLEF